MVTTRLGKSSLKKSTGYYNETADLYDHLHGENLEKEHTRALELLIPRCFSEASSVLDIGTGSGRSLQWINQHYRNLDRQIELNGIEPSTELAIIARDKIPSANILIGDGENLPFDDSAFDFVTITGVLHHVENPRQIMLEAFRVCRIGILISDHNNFSFGSNKIRRLKLALFAIGLLKAFSFVKQGFDKQGYSEDDGWWYPYSLMNDIGFLSDLCDHFVMVPTRRPNSTAGNILMSHSHIAVACIKA